MPMERECAICYCPFTRGSRSPRLLPCQHTFCGECLRALLSLAEPANSGLCQLLCPLCRQPVQARWEGGVLPFPLDPALGGGLLLAEGAQEEETAVGGVGKGTPRDLKRGAKSWLKNLKRKLGLSRQSHSAAIRVTMHDMALMTSFHII